MSVRCIILVLLALAIVMPAYAMEQYPGDEATGGYMMHFSENAEGDGNVYTPQTSINWDYLLSQTPHQEYISGSAGPDSFNMELLLHASKAKTKSNRQVSEYERTIETISAMHTTAANVDDRRAPLFENSNLTVADLRYIYDGIVQSSASVKTNDFSDGSGYLNYLYQMSITSMKSDAAHRMAPFEAPFNYHPATTQISIEGETVNQFTSDTYQYRKATVSPDKSGQSSAGARFSGQSYGTYSRSISNLAHLNSMASDREDADSQGLYSSIISNLNTLLKDEEDEESDTIASRSASIFTEYSLVYSNHSSRKHRSDKIAVVVGVNSYSDRMKLHACVNDARAMAELLGELGYEVVELTDESPIKPTRENILNVAIAKIKSSRNKEKVIFYFSGHGETDKSGTFYMVPQDSRRDPSSYISEYDLEMYLKDIKNLAIIIDACHSGGMKDLVSEGQILIASSKNEEPSNELWNGEMSVFTYNLVNAIRAERMRDYNISLQSCFYIAREGTLKWPGQRLLKQNPVIVDRTGGYFSLT